MAATSTQLPDQSDDVKESHLDHEEGLYRHKKRPEWGVAMLAWEKGERRAYQFEDGRLRKFKKGYYSLMEPNDEDKRPQEAVVRSLREAIETKRGQEPPKPLEPVAPFEAQVELFVELYPEGFKDEQWIEDHRGGGPGRTLKRHRDPAVHETQQALSKERCDQLLGEDRHDELVESVTEILGNTSLVALKHVKVLRAMEEGERKDFAEALRDLLHDEEEAFGPRFKRFLEVMTEVYGGRPSWRIATAIPALMYPGEHACIRRSAFSRQAASVAPLARYSRRATVGGYKNYRRVAFAVRQRLQAAGHEPRDLLDVHDFVWTTLRNAALDHLDT